MLIVNRQGCWLQAFLITFAFSVADQYYYFVFGQS